MKITGMKVSNFLIIKDVDLKTVDKKLVTFVGKNKTGKTSIIKAIRTALKGTTDTSVIRDDAEKAELMLDLDGLKVLRTITKKGANKVKVTTKDGDIKASPQTFLDSLLSDFSFDPIRFVIMDNKDRVKYLRDLFKTKITPAHLEGVVNSELLSDMSIDYTKDGLTVCTDIETVLFSLRRDKNRTVAHKKALYEETIKPLEVAQFDPKFKDMTEEFEQDEADLREILADAHAKKRQADGTKDLCDRTEEKIKAAQADIEQLQNNDNYPLSNQIVAMESEITGLNEQIQKLVDRRNVVESDLKTAQTISLALSDLGKAIETHQNTLDSLPKAEEVPDIAAIQKTLDELLILKADNEIGRKLLATHNKAAEILSEVNEEKAHADQLTESIKKLREDVPQQLSKEAEFPIPSLRFEGDKVFIGNVSMDNLSTAEQVETALTIVRELNKDAKLKVLCLDKAESLDDESMAEFEKQIKNDEFQYFVTIVSHKGQKVPAGSIKVEDGEIR